MKSLSILSLPGLAVLFVLNHARADETSTWPHWRGPATTGVVSQAKPPLTWDENTNVKWKIEVPGEGHATPIIVGDKMFLLAARATGEKVEVEVQEQEAPQTEERRGNRRRRGGFGNRQKPDEIQRFSVICLNRLSGKTLWSKTVKEALPHEGHHRDHGYASCSPVTDGTHLFAFFGSRGLYCLDLNGNVQWEKDFGDMKTVAGFGEGTSPVLVEDKIIVKWDHEGDSFIVALDKKTGKELWRKERDEGTSWASPVAIEHGGQTQVVASATNKILSYNPQNGEVIWESTGMTRNVIPTPVWGDGVVYVTSGFRGSALQAIKLNSTGNVTDTDAVLWTHNEGTPYVPSPLLYQGRLYFFQGNDNRLSCLDAKTGKVHYSRQRVEGLRGVYASPIGAGDHVYLVGRRGNVVVIKCTDKLEIVATNTLDEEFDASPVVIGDQLYLRGKSHLYCLAGSEAVQTTSAADNEEEASQEQKVAEESTKPSPKPETKGSTAASSDVTGSWSWVAQGFGGQEIMAKLTVKQDGNRLTGTTTGGFGEDSITDGKLEGDRISFKTVREFGNNTFTTTYTGKVDGEKIAGTIESPTRDGGTRERDWNAYKNPAIDPIGPWKWSSPSRRNGGQRDHWVKLAYDEGKLSGLYRSTRSQAPIQEAQLKGKELSFKVERRFGNRSFATSYKGILSDGSITGTSTAQRGEETQTAEWKAIPDTPPVDPVGSWSWTSRFGRGGEENTNTLALTTDGDVLGGSVTGRFGESTIKDAKLDGDKLSFEVTVENDNGTFTSNYSGHIDGDVLHGNVAMKFGERSFAIPFKATRTLPKAKPAGTWKWTTRNREGNETINRLAISMQDDGKLSGTMARGDAETPIRDVKLDGQNLTFKLTRTFRDNEMTLHYTGQLRGDVIKGHYALGEDNAGWVTLWNAEREE